MEEWSSKHKIEMTITDRSLNFSGCIVPPQALFHIKSSRDPKRVSRQVMGSCCHRNGTVFEETKKGMQQTERQAKFMADFFRPKATPYTSRSVLTVSASLGSGEIFGAKKKAPKPVAMSPLRAAFGSQPPEKVLRSPRRPIFNPDEPPTSRSTSTPSRPVTPVRSHGWPLSGRELKRLHIIQNQRRRSNDSEDSGSSISLIVENDKEIYSTTKDV
eukprot:GHVH01010866.1.p1 GENE.GHVH01010866.1~~GHVH01010866.1.p1  ORF type:complete len:215 (-),score=40.49 GHVH01010866.1:5-649(-)